MRSIRAVALLSILSVGLGAQAPGAPPVPPQGGPQGPAGAGRGASFILAHTGELELTDAQVTRLAGIARRGEARRKTLRVAMDSARARFAPGQPGDSTARRAFAQRMRTDMQKAVDAARADQRDAIAVLTADQQAKAWEMISRGPGMRGGARMRAGMGGGRARRQGMPGRGMGARPMRPRDEMNQNGMRRQMRERMPMGAPRPPVDQ